MGSSERAGRDADGVSVQPFHLEQRQKGEHGRSGPDLESLHFQKRAELYRITVLNGTESHYSSVRRKVRDRNPASKWNVLLLKR